MGRALFAAAAWLLTNWFDPRVTFPDVRLDRKQQVVEPDVTEKQNVGERIAGVSVVRKYDQRVG